MNPSTPTADDAWTTLTRLGEPLAGPPVRPLRFTAGSSSGVGRRRAGWALARAESQDRLCRPAARSAKPTLTTSWWMAPLPACVRVGDSRAYCFLSAARTGRTRVWRV